MHWRDVTLSSILSLSRVSVSLTVGDEDELEEDVQQSLSYPETFFEIDEDSEEEGKLEEELVDKPGTTTGTKCSVLHCIRIPFLMRCGF